MNKQDIFDEYTRMAPTMEALQRSSSGCISYHLLADALYWSDEIPDQMNSFSENCLRLILRYRTTLILGSPDEKWQPYWDEAVRRFPKWIGFDLQRADPALKDFYDRLRNDAEQESFGKRGIRLAERERRRRLHDRTRNDSGP